MDEELKSEIESDSEAQSAEGTEQSIGSSASESTADPSAENVADSASQELASQELASQELESQELESQELESQELESQELESQELESQELESQELESQEIDAEAKAMDPADATTEEEAIKAEAATESTEPAGKPKTDPADDLPPVDDEEDEVDPSSLEKSWYILKVQVNRETSICDTLKRRVQQYGLGDYFGEMLVPTEDVREYTKSGKQRIVKRKLYPGYIMVNMAITEDSWWLVRDTPGIGDFTGMGGKPAPLGEEEINRIMKAARPETVEDPEAKEEIKTAIKQKIGERVRVKDGNFENFEGDVSAIDERNGRITVLINIFGRLNPVELDHWQVESL